MTNKQIGGVAGTEEIVGVREQFFDELGREEQEGVRSSLVPSVKETRDRLVARRCRVRIPAQSETASPSRSFHGVIWLAGCFLLAGFLAFRGSSSFPSHRLTSPRKVADASSVHSANIEDIRLGQRVIGTNPLRDAHDAAAPDPDPATWRSIELRMTKNNGKLAKIALLRPTDWLRQAGARAGAEIDLNLPEMGVVGPATVVSVKACAPIADGPGNVVTGTFCHEPDDNLVDVRLDGLDTPIGCTETHPFWSSDRRAFVPAGKLKVGEHVKADDGRSIAVVSIRHRDRESLVYNLEVHGQHVYQVSELGILVHNSCQDVLMPNGNPIGTQGSTPGIQELPGGINEAQGLFNQLSQGGTPINAPTYPGTAIQPPEGGFIGIRPISGSGGPAIDINVPDIPINKIHFTRGGPAP